MKSILPAIAMITWSGYALAGDYTVAQLGLLPGGTFNYVTAINNAGQAVGGGDTFYPNAGQLQAAIKWNGTTPTILGTNMTEFIGANAINNAGVVVGDAGSSGDAYAAYWTATGSGNLYGGGPSNAFGVNDSEEIVGQFVVSGLPVMWPNPTTEPKYLPILGGSANRANAQSINAAGHIVGSSYFSDDGTSHATLWTGNSGAYVTDLGTLGGANGAANAINASGHIVGWANTASGDQHAAFWNRQKVIDLGTLGGNTSSANAINAGGYIVGNGTTANGDLHAALWIDTRDKPIDLNTEIDPVLAQQITLTNAVGINDKCQIVVNGIDNKTGVSEAFVLSLKHQSECHRDNSDEDGATS